MDGMTKHRLPEPRKPHLWILAVIAIPAAVEVIACWIGLGAMCGFPLVFGHGTGWTLAVGMEAYAGYGVWAWLAGASGDRSRKFAMWSALAAVGLSILGQVSYHVMKARGITQAPVAVVVLVGCLLVIVLAFAAILTHLMHADVRAARADADAAAAAARRAATDAAAADERGALRDEAADLKAQLADATAALGRAQAQAARAPAAETARDEAQAAGQAAREALETAEAARLEESLRAERAEARAARLDRKLGAGAPAKAPRSATPAAPRTELDAARAARRDADKILAEEPGISGAQLAERVGMSERWGQTYKKQFAERALSETA